MWRKSEDSRPKSASSASESVTPPEPLPSPGAVESPDSRVAPSTVKPGIVIKGEISGQGDFLLDGAFEGRVCLAEGTFRVGSNAHVNAEVEAREIIIRGEFSGTLKAHERIQILSTAKVTGDMDTRGIVIEDGAILHSRVATPRPDRSPDASDKGEARRDLVSEIRARRKSAAAASTQTAPQESPDH